MRAATRRAPITCLEDAPYQRRVLGVARANLIAYWPLTERAGATARNLEGTAARNGTYTGVALADARTGPFGTASPRFDGSASYVNITSTSLDGAFNGNEGTVALWVRVSALGVWTDSARTQAIKLYANNSNYVLITEASGNNQLYMVMFAGGTGKDYVLGPFRSLNWLHIAITWSRSGNALRYYINGAEEYGAVDTSLGNWNASALATALIGATSTDPTEVWSGNLSHVALWNAPLTAQQVEELALVRPTQSLAALTRANAATYLTTPTYDGSGQTVHPSVVDFGAGETWNGYRYWMVSTPLPGGSADYENPSILVSADGDTWADPGTNPIVASPPTGYNSDTELFMEAGGTTTMWVMYRELLDSGNAETIKAVSSTNGTSWSAAATVLTADPQQPGVSTCLLSPTIVYLDGVYHMWTVNADGMVAPHHVEHRTSASITTGWSAPTVCTLTLPDSLQPWHLSVNYRADLGEYHMLVTNLDGTYTPAALYLGRSRDGVNWDISAGPLLKRAASGWDNGHMYRSCWVYTGAGYDLFYSGVSTGGVHHVGRTTVTGI